MRILRPSALTAKILKSETVKVSCIASCIGYQTDFVIVSGLVGGGYRAGYKCRDTGKIKEVIKFKNLGQLKTRFGGCK